VIEAILWSGEAFDVSSTPDGGRIVLRGEGAPELDSPPFGRTKENALPTWRIISLGSSFSIWILLQTQIRIGVFNPVWRVSYEI